MSRADKWAIKTDPDLLCPVLKATHDLSVEEIRRVYGIIDMYYAKTAEILDRNGVIGNFRLTYRCYMEELYKIVSTYTGEAMTEKTTGVSTKYLLYGMDINILREIAQLFGLEALVGLEDIIKEGMQALYPSSVEGTVIADGSEQTVLQSEETEVHWWEGFIDLGALQSGEQVVMREYASVITPASYKLYFDETYTGVLANPMLYIMTKPAKYGLKLTLEQVSGTLRSFPFQLFKREVS